MLDENPSATQTPGRHRLATFTPFGRAPGVSGGMASAGVHLLRQALVVTRLRGNRAEHASFTLDDDHARPLSHEDETRFRDQHWRDNMQTGSRIMIVVDSIYIMLCVYELITGRNPFQTTIALEITGGDGPLNSLVQFILFSYPMAVLPVFFLCIVQPRPKLYVTTVSSFFFYLVLWGLETPTLDCPETSASPPKSSLREYSTVHLLMAWILITPSVFPAKHMLHLTWAYIAVGYVGASLWAFFIKKDGQQNTDAWLKNMIICTGMLCVVNGIAINKKYYIEKGQRSKFVMDLKHKESTRRMFNILEYMIPVHLIAPMLKNPGKVIAEQVECASILFIMFNDFDQTASRLEPHQLLDFLNHHFTLFDGICAKHGVTKIETVGEEYVCAVGVVPADVERCHRRGHQEILGRLVAVAAEILHVAEENDEVELKMGIHTGPVVAGVIGNKLPRFRLFGDTINTAARMMQKGLPGELQFGEETHRCLPKGVSVELRGQIEMKGKGLVTTYLLRRPKPSLVLGPSGTARKQGSKQVKFSIAPEFRSSEHTSKDHVSVRRSRSSRKSISEVLIATGEAVGASMLSVQATGSNASSMCRPASTREAAPPAPPMEVELATFSIRHGSPLLDREQQPQVSKVASSARASAVTATSSTRYASRSDGVSASEAFEKAVQEVCQATIGGEHIPSEEGTLLDRSKRWLARFGPGWNTFPKEMEAGFNRWYHDTAIVKKLDRRLEVQLLVASIMTTLDLIWTVFVTKVFDEESVMGSKSEMRMPAFLVCRILTFMIVATWRFAAAQEWVRKAPKDMQTRLLVSYSIISLLWFVSFDMVTGEMSRCDEHPPEGVFMFAWVPVYFIVTTIHPLLFTHSCVFVVEAALISYLSSCSQYNLHFELATKLCLVGNSFLNAFLAHTSEKSLRARYTANESISLAQGRIEHILNTLMPVQVVEEIRDNELQAPPRAHPYKCATVAQSDLCGFTKLASTRRPEEVVEFIGELFGAFDELTDRYEIYKVETVGDAYIAGQADVPLTYKNSPISVILFGLDMVRATHEWSRKRGETVSCRVGIHTGECIGGIVGSEMQRYHLFGRLMAGLEILESTAPEGRVQVSKGCKEAVDAQMKESGREAGREVSIFEPRQERQLTTSKGEVHEFEEVGGPTFIVKSYAQVTGQLAATAGSSL